MNEEFFIVWGSKSKVTKAVPCGKHDRKIGGDPYALKGIAWRDTSWHEQIATITSARCDQNCSCLRKQSLDPRDCIMRVLET